MRNVTILLFALQTGVITFGQKISERLILTDTKDSIYLNSVKKTFDNKGNYCFAIEQNDSVYLVTPNDKFGAFKFVGSTYGPSGEINYTKSGSEPKDKRFFYKNANGTKVYGTAKGKIEDYQTSNTKENIALVTTLNDSVYYYINGRLLNQKLKDPEKYYGLEKDWVSFSENGNKIYSINQDKSYHLYVNDKLIDTSKFSYTQMAINNNGDYVFAKGKKPEPKIGKYDYLFYVHSKDTILDYVRTVWNYELKENGAYYYSGDDNGPYYIAINDKLHKNIKTVSNITLIDRQNFMYTYGEDGKTKINVSGKTFTYDFDEIVSPTMDKEGNFAFYGLKDYYLYKYVNGQKEDQPISKYGVRPTPLYISSKGESIHYFSTDDSIYVYKDDELFFKPIAKKSGFKVLPHNEILHDNFVRGKSENGNSLFYIEFDSTGYFVYNGVFSKSMIPAKKSTYSNTKRNGEIVAGELNDSGFFVIQKTGSSKYVININNRIFEELENVDMIFDDNYFFNDKELIFYGVKGLSFYQFKLSL